MVAQKASAFIVRDFLIASSYKFAFLFELLASIFPIITFYFISKLLGGSKITSLAEYGGKYFPFAVIGLAFTQYFMLSLTNFADTIRHDQIAGRFEMVLSAQTYPGAVAALSSLYSFIARAVHIALVLAIGGIFFGVDFRQADMTSVVIVLALSFLTFSSLGIFFASFILIFKRSEPIEWIFGALCPILGGAFFPVSIMPHWMQYVANCFPMAHSLHAVRLAMLQGYSIAMLSSQLTILSCMAVVLLPSSIWVFSRAVDRGRRTGILMHY